MKVNEINELTKPCLAQAFRHWVSFISLAIFPYYKSIREERTDERMSESVDRQRDGHTTVKEMRGRI